MFETKQNFFEDITLRDLNDWKSLYMYIYDCLKVFRLIFRNLNLRDEMYKNRKNRVKLTMIL